MSQAKSALDEVAGKVEDVLNLPAKCFSVESDNLILFSLSTVPFRLEQDVIAKCRKHKYNIVFRLRTILLASYVLYATGANAFLYL